MDTNCELEVFKQRIFDELVKLRSDELGIHSPDQMRLRNPKVSQIEFQPNVAGEVIHLKTEQEMEQMRAYMLKYS